MARFGFNPNGGRTDGREIRPHKPWKLNTGKETANPARATNPGTPRTDFASALAPRLKDSGMFTPRLGGLVEQSGSLQGPTLSGAPMTGRPVLAVPTDGQQPSMFASVTDEGSQPPLNTAQRWQRQGRQIIGLPAAGSLGASRVVSGLPAGQFASATFTRPSLGNVARRKDLPY